MNILENITDAIENNDINELFQIQESLSGYLISEGERETYRRLIGATIELIENAE